MIGKRMPGTPELERATASAAGDRKQMHLPVETHPGM